MGEKWLFGCKPQWMIFSLHVTRLHVPHYTSQHSKLLKKAIWICDIGEVFQRKNTIFLWNVFSRSIASPPQPPTPVCKFKIWCASFLWSLEHRSPNDLKQPLCSGKCFRKRGTITKAPLSWYLHKSDQKLTYEPSQHEVDDMCIVHVTLYWLLAPIAFLCSAEMGGFDELGLEGAGFFGLSLST